MNAYTGLETLEKTGELRRYVSDNNATAINEFLDPYIPSFLSRAVVIFNDTTNLTTKPSLIDVNDSISVSYFLAGDFDDYKPRDVRIYIWGYEKKYTTTTTTIPGCTGTNVCDCGQYETQEDCMLGGDICAPLFCCQWLKNACQVNPCSQIETEASCNKCTGCSWE